MEVYSSLDGLDSNNNFRRSRSISENNFSDSDESKSESERQPFTYFLSNSDEGLVHYKQAQSEGLSSWIHVDVFKTIHTEVNTDRFKCQIRHLTLAMVEGNKWNLRFEEKLFSNPIVTWVPNTMNTSKNQVILIYHVKRNSYFCIFGKTYLELIDCLYKDRTLLQDLRDCLMKNNGNSNVMTLETPDGQVDVVSEKPVGTTVTNTVGTAQDGYSPFHTAEYIEPSIQEFIEKQYFKITAVAKLPLHPRMKISNDFDLKKPFSDSSRRRRTAYSFNLDKVGYVTSHGTYEVWDCSH